MELVVPTDDKQLADLSRLTDYPDDIEYIIKAFANSDIIIDKITAVVIWEKYCGIDLSAGWIAPDGYGFDHLPTITKHHWGDYIPYDETTIFNCPYDLTILCQDLETCIECEIWKLTRNNKPIGQYASVELDEYAGDNTLTGTIKVKLECDMPEYLIRK